MNPEAINQNRGLLTNLVRIAALGTPNGSLAPGRHGAHHGPMANEPKESSDASAAEPATQPQDDKGRDDHGSVARDLADGLDLMLRAARKAVRHVDPQNIEALGRRALGNLDALKRRRVEDLKHEAKRRLDRRRLEEIAEDAGKELLRVVER